MTGDRAALAEALRTSTVMVSAPGRIGTGFFVAPGQVLTCAHVVVGPTREPPERLAGQWGDADLDLEVMQFRPDHDLALLRVVGELVHPVACLATQIEPGDELWACGHPDGAYRRGDVIRSVYDGPSVDADGLELLRITEGRAVEGFSGGPVLNWRTGGVCGVLRRADAPPGGPPGARLIGAARVLEVFPRLIKPPSMLTPDRVPWFRLLDDKQLAAGRWCYPGPRLRGFLQAAQVTAREHPYRLALPNAPQLSTVYLRQQATRVIDGEEATEDGVEFGVEDQPIHADLVLEGDRRCVFVVGGPGSGKSSLLRYLAETTAGRWLTDASAPGVPILVPAGALAMDRPLPEALAEGVTAALGARLADRRLADMFEDEPLPGIPWMILVDGVDEILDPERRKRVLETLAFWRSRPSPFRFLVTSRPLPQGQLDALRKDGVPLYDIEPFSEDQLPEFARRWFSALGIPDPNALVDAFLDQLADTQLSRLAEVPLIATMLCVVFASQDGQYLPPSRVGLYEAFVSLLMAKQHTQINALERLQQWIRPYGTAAEEAVDQLLAGLRPLLEQLADQRLQTRGPEALLDSAIMHVRDLRPAHLPAAKWRDLVEEALRLSGLVVERSGQLSFFHYTIQEYLAVCARELPANIVPEVLEQQRSGRNSFSLLRAGVLVSRSPDQAREVAVALSKTDLAGLAFLAALVHDGVQFPDDLVAKARDQLKRYSETPDIAWSATTYEAAEALALIDPDLGFRYWEQFANDNDLARRAVAIGMMLRINPHRGAPILEPIALKWETPLRIRRAIVFELTVVNRQRSDELLTKMAVTGLIDNEATLWAAKLLCQRVDHPTEIKLLAGIASDSSLPGSYRRWAAEQLYSWGPERGSAALVTIATDRTTQGSDRLYAVQAMIRFSESYRRYRHRPRREWCPQADELLEMIALDPAVEAAYRIKAAQELIDESPQRARAALALVAEDRYVDGTDRARAAAALANLALPRAVAALTTIAADPASGGDGRLQAALALAWINRSRAANALLDIAADRRVDGNIRAAAAHQLDWIDRPALPSALSIIAYDKQIDGEHRTQAALRLSNLSPEPGRLALETLVTDPTINPAARLQVACQLAALKSDKAPDALASLSAERDLGATQRLHAALESGQAGPLAELAADASLDGMHRVRAAFELAATNRIRGIEALTSLSEDPATDHVREELARTDILRMRRERIKYFRIHPYDRDTKDAPKADLGGIPSYRVQAARLLVHYDRATAIARLMALAHDADEGVASQAITALAETDRR